MHRIRATIRKEFLQFSRDRMLMVLILWTYTIEVVLCVYALSFDVKNLKLAVYDQDRTQMSQRLIERFTSTEYFTMAFFASDSGKIERLLDAGKADMGMIIPPDFSDRVSRGREAGVQILLSGTNSNTANMARSYATAILGGFSRDILAAYLMKKGLVGDVPEVEPRVRIWYNAELTFRYFMVISMIIVAGFMVGVVHTAATIVREKETGTIEQIMVTTLRKHELILAKMVPTITVGLLALFPSLLIALWFKLPMRGSIPLFFLASAVNLFTSMGIGVYISTIARNLQQALLLSIFILFPVMFLSGTLVPIESMPLALQYLTLLSPLRYYMEISLGIFLKGIGLEILWQKFALLFAMGALIFTASLYRLRRRIYE